MDRVHIRTRHTSASVTYDGSFSTDTKDRESLEAGVVLQITHASGVIEVSEIVDSSKMHVVSTTKTVIHDRGPKQSSGGSPWVGSVEGGGDVKDIFADGTLVISPYQAVSGVQQPPGNTTTIKTPGGAISIKRDGSRIDVAVACSTSYHVSSKSSEPAVKKRKKHRESPAGASSHAGSVQSLGSTDAQIELANALQVLSNDVELDFSTC